MRSEAQKLRKLEYDREYHRLGRQANPVKYRAREALKQRRWAKENKVYIRRMIHLRRQRTKATKGSYGLADIERILLAQGYRCAYCPARITETYSIDHIIPLARGGTNEARNIQLTCTPCNKSKWAKDPLDFARELGLLL